MVLTRVAPQSSSSYREGPGDIMVSQMIQFYEDRLGRVITEAEQEAVRTMYEEFRSPMSHREGLNSASHRIGSRATLTRTGF